MEDFGQVVPQLLMKRQTVSHRYWGNTDWGFALCSPEWGERDRGTVATRGKPYVYPVSNPRDAWNVAAWLHCLTHSAVQN